VSATASRPRGILAVDTATAQGSVALVEPGAPPRVIALGARDHGRSLAPAVQALVEGRWSRVEGYAIAIGPGSFTGLRVGLSFLKGLALAEPRPLAPVSTLALLARAARADAAHRAELDGGAPLLAALDARNGEVFARLDDDEVGLVRIDALAARAARPGVIVGDPIPALDAALSAWRRAPAPGLLAGVLAAWAAASPDAGADAVRWTDGLQDLEPTYGQGAAVDRRLAEAGRPSS
jgi:tRNA threonylcarbamoyladenosine biosynthesis protein TsaB